MSSDFLLHDTRLSLRHWNNISCCCCSPFIFWRLRLAVCSFTLMMMMIMSMGWNCVSELRPQTDLLSTPQVIHEHGDPWCNNIDRGNSWCLLQRSLEIPLADLYINKVGWSGEENYEFCVTKCFFHSLKGSLTCRKMSHGADGFTSLWRNACCRFSRPLKIHRHRLSFDPRTLRQIASTLTTIPPRTTCSSL
jgi:hypothetical protein